MAKAPRLTGQREIFCREFVACGVASTAYRRAFKVGERTKAKTVWEAASHLMADAKVSARIQELWDKGTDVRLGEIVAGYRQARDIALEDRQPAAVTGAVSGLARVKGYLKDDPAKAGDVHIHFEAKIAGVL